MTKEDNERLATPADRQSANLPAFDPWSPSVPPPTAPGPRPTPTVPAPAPPPAESTVKVSAAEIAILRSDAAWAQRTRRVLQRFERLPVVLRRLADMVEDLLRS